MLTGIKIYRLFKDSMIVYIENPKESNKTTRISEFSKTNHINTHDSQSVSCSFMSPHGLQPNRFLCPEDFLGKNTGVSGHSLLHGIFLTQGSKPYLLPWQADSLPLSHQGSLCYLLGLVKSASATLSFSRPLENNWDLKKKKMIVSKVRKDNGTAGE